MIVVSEYSGQGSSFIGTIPVPQLPATAVASHGEDRAIVVNLSPGTLLVDIWTSTGCYLGVGTPPVSVTDNDGFAPPGRSQFALDGNQALYLAPVGVGFSFLGATSYPTA